MKPESMRVLLVAADRAGADELRRLLAGAAPFPARAVTGCAAGVRAALECAEHVVLSAMALGDGTGVELVERTVAMGCPLPVVLLADAGEEDADGAALRAGAADFLPRAELTPALLRRTLVHAVERRVAEGALRESRRQLATLLSSLPGLAYRCTADPGYTMLFVSDGCMALTGYAPDELLQGLGAFATLVHPEDRDRVWRAVQAGVRADRPYAVEYRLVDRQGRVKRVKEQGRPFRTADGETVLEGYIHDVSEEIRAREALERTGAYFRALIESSSESVAVAERDGTLRYASPATDRILGFKPEGRTGVRVLERLHPDDREAGQEALAHLLAHPGATAHFEGRVRHADGSWRTLEITARNLLGDPAVGGVVFNSRDVTQRRETEEALRKRERQFRSLIQYGLDIIAILEGTGEVRFASPAVERVLGYPWHELAGLHVFELVHPDQVQAVLDTLERAVRRPGEPQMVEFLARGKDGGWRTLETFATSLLNDLDVQGIVVNARDVTERRLAEAALQQSQQQLLQAQKMDAIGRLAGGVAHDFNNLLTAVRGNAELLLMDLPLDHPSRLDVEEIRRAADRAAALTRQLLAFSRRQVLQPRVLDLNAVLSGVEKMLRRLIGEDVALQTELGPGLRTVVADPGQLEQVILNLAINARDAMPGGGTLTLRTENAPLTDQDARRHAYVVPGDYVLLTVTDTGHGMDAETRERAFEPFFTTKPAGMGTGLGLSTVYGIIKQSGGYVWMDSAPGRGTAVRVYLPPAEGAGMALREEHAVFDLPRGAETVLLAEDEETVRNLARRILERAGYTVLEARDGAHALQLANGHAGPLHLLLTDVVMPHLSGYELARHVRRRRPDARVIYISGYSEEAVARKGQVEPGTVFVEKPFTAEVLAARVRQVLDGPPPPPVDDDDVEEDDAAEPDRATA